MESSGRFSAIAAAHRWNRRGALLDICQQNTYFCAKGAGNALRKNETSLPLQCKTKDDFPGRIRFVYASKKIDLEFVLGIKDPVSRREAMAFPQRAIASADALFLAPAAPSFHACSPTLFCLPPRPFCYRFRVSCTCTSLRQGLLMSCMALPCVSLSSTRVRA